MTAEESRAGMLAWSLSSGPRSYSGVPYSGKVGHTALLSRASVKATPFMPLCNQNRVHNNSPFEQMIKPVGASEE